MDVTGVALLLTPGSQLELLVMVMTTILSMGVKHFNMNRRIISVKFFERRVEKAALSYKSIGVHFF